MPALVLLVYALDNLGLSAAMAILTLDSMHAKVKIGRRQTGDNMKENINKTARTKELLGGEIGMKNINFRMTFM